MNSDISVWIYRHYIANSLRLMPQNQYIPSTLMEILEPQEERSGEEVIEDIMEKAGLIWE